MKKYVQVRARARAKPGHVTPTLPSDPSLTGTWWYRTAGDEPLAAVQRFDRQGTRSFRPWRVRFDPNGKLSVEARAPERPRPLYNLPDHGRQAPDAIVLVVEGEKTADAARRLFPTYWVTTWMGGAGGVDAADLSPLAGRRLILWPDHDDVGRRAMRKVANRAAAAEVRIIDTDEFFRVLNLQPEVGWDLADYVGRPEVLQSLMYDTRIFVASAGPPEADEWPELGTLNVDQKPQDVDLRSMLPDDLDWLRQYCEALALSIGVAPDWPAMLCVTLAGAAAAGAAEIEVRPGYREVAVLWSLAVGAPSERKTPVFTQVTDPFRAWVREYAAELRTPLARYESERAVLRHMCEGLAARMPRVKRAERARLRADLEEATRRLSEMPELRLPELIISDTTPEALSEVIQRNGGQVAILDDEGAVVSAMLGRYSDDGARVEMICKGYSGSDATILRARREPITLVQPLISQGLVLQPAVLRSILDAHDATQRGYFSRFLIIQPPSWLGRGIWDAEPVPDYLVEAWRAGISGILERTRKGRVKLKAGVPVRATDEPEIVHLSEEAAKIVRNFHMEVEARLRPEAEDLNDPFGWAGKIRGNIYRIALALHLLIGRSGPVSAATMAAATAWFPYLESHFRCAVRNAAEPAPLRHARRLLQQIKKRQAATFTGRDALSWIETSSLPDMATLEPSLLALIEHGYIREVEPLRFALRGRPPKTKYEVNPRVFNAP